MHVNAGSLAMQLVTLKDLSRARPAAKTVRALRNHIKTVADKRHEILDNETLGKLFATVTTLQFAK